MRKPTVFLIAITALLCFMCRKITLAQIPQTNDPFQIIQNVVERQNSVVFQGIKVMAHWWGPRLTVQAARIYKEKYHERFDYFPFEDHSYQSVIINGKSIYYFKPLKSFAYRSPFDYHGPKEKTILQLAAKNYHWNDEGREEVAGFQTERISATPDGENMPVARFWVLQDHPVILREERYDSTGRLYMASFYAYITFPSNLSFTLFQLPPSYQVRNLPTPRELQGGNALKSLDFNPVMPRFIPTGFQLVGTYLTWWRTHAKLDLVYSDGLRDFSIYENLHHAPYHKLEDSHVILIKGHYVEFLEWPEGKLIRFAQGPLTIAVVGNLSEKTMADIALNTATPMAMHPPGAVRKVAHYFMRGLQTIRRFLWTKLRLASR